MRVWHYDGRNALKRWPELRLEEGGFRLMEGAWEGDPVVWADLSFISDRGEARIYGHSHLPGWRLGFEGEIPAEIAAHLPAHSRYGAWIDRVGLTRAALAFAGIAAVAVFIGLKTPGWVAPFVPLSWERKLGDAMVGDFGGRFCRTGPGQDALRKLVARLEGPDDGPAVEVANIGMVNAVALPGGRIIIFQGLIDKAKSADEVAGVLGHEMGHVRHRDTIQALIRQLGLSVVLGGFSGDVGGYVNGALSMSYSRDAEARADKASIEALKRANISPLDTAAFFDRMAKGEKAMGRMADALNYMSSHPLSESRRKAFAKSAIKEHRYGEALSPAEWQALRSMCKNDPKVAKDDGFLP